MRKRNLTALLIASLAGCTGSDALVTDDYVKPEDGKADSSAIATILEFDFDAHLYTGSTTTSGAKRIVQDQLLYTIGHLNEQRSVGRLDRLDVTNIQISQENGKTRVDYHAHMPVAWGSKTNLPTSYELKLPVDVSYTGQSSFTEKYKSSCVEWGAHDVDSGSMWYYYRPAKSSCHLDAADIVVTTATVAVSTVNTTGKYPEYHKVWEDGVLKVVAVFGKYEDGATSSGDAGIAAYNEFVSALSSALRPYAMTTVPATVPTAPGVASPDIAFSATLPDGKKIEVVALLVDNVASAGTAFYDRYEDLSTRADLIAYNGHAGLGQNVRALAQKGRWVAGQYVIVFMNGCDTYAYVDGSLAATRARVNLDDPTGTKYMEFVVNAMPAFFASDSEASMAMIKGLMSHEAPSTYEQMFKQIDRSQIVLVTGENDNVYVPGYDPNGGEPETPPTEWTGLSESGTLARSQEVRYATPELAAGAYVFELTGTGDADLYVRAGTEPTTKLYDCRPYKSGSTETCVVTLPSAAPLHAMVRGYSTTSTFELVAYPQP